VNEQQAFDFLINLLPHCRILDAQGNPLTMGDNVRLVQALTLLKPPDDAKGLAGVQ
jgi:hypothetical protein